MNREKAKLMQIEVCETAKKMASGGLTAGTWGNISGRIDDTYMVITPSGMDYAKLVPEQMVIVNMKTQEYEGNLKPSVETPIHSRILLGKPEVNGIVHTHSTNALTIATTRKGIPPICDDQVQILGGDIRCAGYTYPGSQEMADTVFEALDQRAGALIANHGAITVGRTLAEALTGSEVLEKTAQVYLNVQAIGGAVEISKEDCEFYHDFFMNKYGQK